MADYTLRAFTPISTKNFVADLTEIMPDWSRSIRSMGGYWVGSGTIRGDFKTLQQIYYNWLFYHIEEAAGAVTWEGIVYEMDFVTGGVTRRISLDDVWNASKAIYIDGNNEQKETAFSTNDESIALYGRREEVLSFEGLPEDTAELRRDKYIRQNAWPLSKPQRLEVGRRNDTFLKMTMCGYVFTANSKYVTVASEIDTNQGTLSYLATPDRFSDTGQDFSDYETLSGDAKYSIRITNDDGTFTWAYLGAASGSNQIIAAYQDQSLSTAGWNDTNPSGKTPQSYAIYGPVSDYISSLVSTDCQYLDVGTIDENLAQVSRLQQAPIRTWDLINDLVDTGGDNVPWQFCVEADRRVRYQEIDVEPQYFLRDGKFYTSAGSSEMVNGWNFQPGIVRDVEYPVARQDISQNWLTDARDIYVREVEMSAINGLRPKL